MKKLILIAGMLAMVILMNGCGDQSKDAALETVGTPQAEVVTESTAEARAAQEAIIEDTAEMMGQAEEVVVEVQTPQEPVVEAAAPQVQTPEQAPAAPAQPVVEESPAVTEAQTPAAPEGTGVAVTINGQAITEQAVSEEATKRMDAQKKRMPAGMEMPESYSQQIRRRVVDMMVEQALLDQAMAGKSLTIPDDAVLAEITKIAGQKGQSMEEVEKQIAEWGMTIEDLKGQVRTQMQVKALIEAQGTDTAVSEADAQAFYDQNPQYFEQPEQVQASHILIKVEPNATDEQKAEAKKKIEDLLVQVKGGTDFAELAKTNSDCPSSAKGGDLGLFGRGQMVPAFEQAAFAMNVGDVSDVVETQFGYHIIKLTGKKEAGKTSFDEVKEQITEYLTQQKQKEAWDAYNKTLHDNATIEYSAKEQALRDAMDKAAAAPKTMPIQPQTAPAPQQAEQGQE